MPTGSYRPILALTRGETVESVHYGAVIVVNSRGEQLFAHGDPETITYLRSSAKPFQALPLIESGGAKHWHLTPKEIAITCASHSGTDDHANTLGGMQAKIGITEKHLQCGVHAPIDAETAKTLVQKQLDPTPNRHNCSGKHTGMLAYAQMKGYSLDDYLDPRHPLQQEILQTFCEMCMLDPALVALGTDGCSAPNFAIHLRNAALGFARLVDPWALSDQRAAACKVITSAMTQHPKMVAGPGRFDTRLMAATCGKIVSKGGAEGYQALGILPGVLGADAPGIGVAIKISDGDPRGRARPAVALEILHSLGVLTTEEAQSLADLGPRFEIRNWRKILVGEAYPTLKIERNWRIGP
jgi:L-asparaginase II